MSHERLPEPDTLLGRHVEPVAQPDAEGFIPFIDIRQRPIEPHPGDGVAALRQLVADGIVGETGAPALRTPQRKKRWSPVRPSTIAASFPCRDE